MVTMKLDKRSVKNIQNKLKAMPAKLQRKALRDTISPEVKKLSSTFRATTPIGKRQHFNKMNSKFGSGFLKKSFTVRNTGKRDIAGRGVGTTAQGYYLFMSPNETGRRGGTGISKRSKRRATWGAVEGARKYSKIWKSRQLRITARLTKSLGLELNKV